LKFLAPLAIAALLVLPAAAQPTSPSQASIRTYIEQSEAAWATSVAHPDPALLDRILADDYVGVNPDGTLGTKAQAIAEARKGPGTFLSNRIDRVTVRFYGNTAVAQGAESWTTSDPAHPKGQFIWTDTWVNRNGKWQIVASEDLVP
jgi:Domain of unknown function (DUF4440)